MLPVSSLIGSAKLATRIQLIDHSFILLFFPAAFRSTESRTSWKEKANDCRSSSSSSSTQEETDGGESKRGKLHTAIIIVFLAVLARCVRFPFI